MNERIIIIEDEAIIAAEIHSTLELLGYRVVGHTNNGDKALDLFARTESDLIILDINIKGSLNGIDLAKIIKRKYNIPYVFLTSYSDRTTINMVKETMPYGYIVKPFNEIDLKVNIEMALFKFQQQEKKLEFGKAYIEKILGKELSDREYALLLAFKQGKSYKEAAIELNVSVNTIKSYQKRIYVLFKVNSKIDLIKKLNDL